MKHKKMELLDKYDDEDKKDIMATLNVVQKNGWSANNSDQYQFHIILGSELRSQESKIKQLESDLEALDDESKQKLKGFTDVKEELRRERENNDDMEHEMKKKEDEMDLLRMHIKAKVNELEHLEILDGERLEEISDLRENNISMGAQIAENILLEKRVKIQEDLISKLRQNGDPNDEEKSESSRAKVEIEQLLNEIKLIEKANDEKELMLERFSDENAALVVKLEMIKEKNNDLKTSLQKFQELEEHSVPISEELTDSNFACTETFQCEMCEKIFSTKKDLKCHDKLMHRANVRKLLTGRFNSLKNQVITQKLKISENILSLNMKEHFEIQTCRCKGKCHINHFKHNWVKHRSRDLHKEMKNRLSQKPDYRFFAEILGGYLS